MRRMPVFAALATSGIAIFVACKSTPAAAPPEQIEAGAPSFDSGFAGSTCSKCVDGLCGTVVDACVREPTCARWLACLYACPATAAGAVDKACADACPPPEGSAAAEARGAYQACSDRVS